MANLVSDWLVLAGQTPEQVRQIIVDYLSDMTTNTFDPVKADAVFEQGGVCV